MTYGKEQSSYLVKALQQAHDAALNLLLLQASAGAVHPHGNEALNTRDSNSRSCQ